MDKIKRHIFFLISASILTIIIHGCEESFVVDITDPRLPEYSESGRNHAGAYINDQPWRYYPRYTFKGGEAPADLRFDEATDSYILSFPPGNYITPWGTHGALGDIFFILSAESVRPILEETAQYPFVISLDGELARAELLLYDGQTSSTRVPCFSSKGQLHLRKLSVSGSDPERRILIAGTFGFDVDDQCGTYEVHSGRFDLFFRCFSQSCF